MVVADGAVVGDRSTGSRSLAGSLLEVTSAVPRLATTTTAAMTRSRRRRPGGGWESESAAHWARRVSSSGSDTSKVYHAISDVFIVFSNQAGNVAGVGTMMLP